jgi:hypothetical protein
MAKGIAVGEAPGKPVRVHVAEPRPDQDPDVGALEDQGDQRENDQRYSNIPHASSFPDSPRHGRCYVAHDIAELSGCLRRRSPVPVPHPPRTPRRAGPGPLPGCRLDRRRGRNRPGDQQEAGMVDIFLDDLEVRHAGYIAHDIDQGQAMHQGAVPGHDEVGAAPSMACSTGNPRRRGSGSSTVYRYHRCDSE